MSPGPGFGICQGEEVLSRPAALHPRVRLEANVDALLMLLFTLLTMPIAVVTRDPHFCEHEGLVSGMIPLEAGPETATLPLVESVLSSEETPVAW